MEIYHHSEFERSEAIGAQFEVMADKLNKIEDLENRIEKLERLIKDIV